MANTPNINQLMEMAQQMQKGMVDVQKNLAEKQVTGAAGTGDLSVEVTMNGLQHVVAIKITDGVMQEGKQVLVDLIISATNSAIEKVKEVTKQAMVDVYQKVGMPTDEIG